MGAVVLLSGGIDSTTCLAMAVEEFGAENVTALTMFYGQKHDKELESAAAVADFYGVRHLVRDLSTVFEFDNNPLLKKSGKEIPQGTYEEQRGESGVVSTYVPFRNGLFLSYASAIAYSLGASLVFYGAHSDDAAGEAYPDCTPQFYFYMNNAIWEGTGKKIQLEAPLLKRNKSEVVKRGLQLGAPYELSWSCYEGDEKACGKCATCVDRLNAFHDNNTFDPIEYVGEDEL